MLVCRHGVWKAYKRECGERREDFPHHEEKSSLVTSKAYNTSIKQFFLLNEILA